MRESKIQYNPALSVRDNAKKNGVSEAAVRYYVKINHIDRRFERKQNIIADCRKYLQKHPIATRDELSEKTGHSLSTIRKYWEFISTKKKLTDYDSEKAKKRQQKEEEVHNRQVAYLDKIPISVIEQYLAERKEQKELKKVDAVKPQASASVEKKKQTNTERSQISQPEVPQTSERVYGILGAVIGDIVGSRFEFLKTFPKYDFKMFGSANLFTDDTIMTVAIADALIHQKGFQEAMLEWGRKYPNGGWGGRFRKWLKSNNPQPYNSKGNGCGMRISPVGFYGNTLEEVLDLATKATIPTHGSEEGLKGAKAIASAIFLARQQKPKSEIKKYIEDNFGYNLDCTKEEIVSMVQHFEKGMGELAEYSVPVAIIAFLNGNDFEDTMRIAMTYGGDADTIGAMLGGISAAYYGVPMNIAQEAVKYLSQDILDVINEFDKTSFISPRITPSITHEWNTDCVVVYGRSVNDGENGEDGSYDVHNTRNRHKIDGYAIRTIGADFKDTKQDVEAFVQYVEEHPQKTFLVKRVGIQKANIPVEMIAPLFKPLKDTTNVFLPTEFRQYLENDN